MRVTVAVDSFKGSVSSLKLCKLADKVAEGFPEAEVRCIPVGDGGEGTAEAVTYGLRPLKKKVTVTAKNGRKKQATYYIVEGRAYANVADVCGLSAENRKEDALIAFTSYGVGELLLAMANDPDVMEIALALGGSGTVDGGAGMLVALGAELTDAFGRKTGYLPADLDRVTSVNLDKAKEALCKKPFTLLSDTTAPLLGIGGAVDLFAEQKGASSGGKRFLERALGIFVRAVEKSGENLSSQTAGAGAAGGIGYAGILLGATVQSGLEYLFAFRGYGQAVVDSDVVISGEGFLDGTSFTGKAVSRIAELCEKEGKPLYLVVGEQEAFLPLPETVKGVFTLRERAKDRAECFLQAEDLFCKALTDLFRTLTE